MGLNGLQGLELSRIPQEWTSVPSLQMDQTFSLWLVEFSIGLVGCFANKVKVDLRNALTIIQFLRLMGGFLVLQLQLIGVGYLAGDLLSSEI